MPDDSTPPRPPDVVVVLAAGAGTRMRSATPKVLHAIGGRTLLGHAVATARGLDPAHLVVVVGHGREAVAPHVAAVDPGAVVAVQDEQHGTGHAVQCALAAVPAAESGQPLTVVVTYADVPLLETATLAALVADHERSGSAATVLTADVADPTGYGRVLRDPTDPHQVAAIVEHRDATADQLAVTEINSGIYAFDEAVLRDALGRITRDNDQGELYLTDVLALVRADGRRTGAVALADPWQTEGVNDRVQLATLGRELNDRVLRRWMREGVTVVDPSSTWVDVTVVLEPDVTLLPGTQLHGGTTVAAGAVIGPDSTLRDCRIGPGATVIRSHAVEAELQEQASCGPFCYLRPGAVIGPRARAGAFVEVKASFIGPGSKVPHLTYVGDAQLGEGVNIGAASVFVNYDGARKHRTVIGDHARVGSDTMLVAPVTVGAGAYTAAGSVITQDVPPGAMAVARARQRNVEGWVDRRRAGTASAAAAAQARATPAPGAGPGPVEGQGGAGIGQTGPPAAAPPVAADEGA
jgi:bifunctional UDP-N-acetylglucosamine pyrophosphorylase/glucosamine-1-phosphate N-acetyltransferase